MNLTPRYGASWARRHSTTASAGTSFWRRVNALDSVDYADHHACFDHDAKVDVPADLWPWLADRVAVARDLRRSAMPWQHRAMPQGTSSSRPPSAASSNRARWLLLGIVTGIAACATPATPAQRPSLTSPSSPSPPSPPSPPTPAPSLDTPSCGSPRLVAIHADGARDVVCDSIRATLRPHGAPAVAAQRLREPIVAAAPVARGWVFVDADGAITRADTFLGPLHLVGRVPCAARPAHAVRASGRVAVLDARGALWTTDGTAPPARATLPARVLSAAFFDSARGAAALEHGELVATRDGGRSWSPVDLQHEVAWQVALTPQGLVIATTAGAQSFDADGPHPLGRCLDDEAGELSHADPTSADEPPVALRAPEVFDLATVADECQPAEASEREAEPAGDPYDHPAFGADDRAPTYACRIAGGADAVRSVEVPAPPGAPPGSGRSAVFLGGSGDATAHLWWTPEGRARLHLAWSGLDAAGAFEGRAGPEVTGLPLHPDVDHTREEVVVEALSRRGAVVSSDGLDELMFWAPTGGPLASLGRPSAACFDEHERRRLFVALPDGGVAMLQWFEDLQRTTIAALELGPDGVIRRRRGLLGDSSSYVVLGRWDGALGIVLWRPGASTPARFHPFDGGAPRPLPRAPSGSPRACAGPAAPDGPATIRLWFNTTGARFNLANAATRGIPEWLLSPSRIEVEWARGRACVRSVSLRYGSHRPADFRGVTTTLAARPGDRFEGSLRDAGRVRVSCGAAR